MCTRNSGRCGFALVLSILLFSGIFLGSVTQVHAQTATVTSFAASTADDFTGLIQAGDGNFYGISTGGAAADWACQDIPANSCTYIDKITPGGVVTQLYTFERAPGDTTTPYDANQIIEGSDGFFYGTTQQGGTGFGYGTIFRLTNYGVFTVLYNFPGDKTNGPTNGYAPGPLTQGEDGNFYGIAKASNGIVFFSMTTGGVVTILHQAVGTDGFIFTDSGSVLQGSDGNFYTNTTAGFLQITPSGQVTVIDPYAFSSTQINGPTGPLVEGSDFNYYGTSPFTTYNPDGSSRGDGAIFKLSTSGTLQTLYTFSGGADGYIANADLTLGSDGNLYGTTYYGGNPACPSNMGTLGIAGCGTIFEIGTSGGFHSLYAFSGTPADGGRPIGPLVQDGSGIFNGTTFANFGKNIFVAALSTPIPAAIQLSFNPKSVPPGNPTVLTWSVLNAFSRTMRQCHATIQGYPSGAGQWSGAQAGTFPNNGNVYTGTATITPTAAGTYTYALTCGGRESGFATLVVNDQLNVPPVLPNGLVGAAYAMPLAEFSGVPPYVTTVTSGTPPPGLTLNPATGVFQGSPTQFGTFTLGLQVTDSNSPKVTATGTTTLTIKSSLAVTTTTLPSGTIGASYSQTLKATGGVPPYLWSVTAGTLPNGIQLAASTGILSGTPTKEETQNITLQVADSEGTPATSTVSLPLVIKPPAPIAAVEFTQAIQQYQTLDDLKTTLSASGEPLVPIISGKPLVMRVYYTPLPTVTHYTMVVSGPLSATAFFAALPGCEPADQRARTGVCGALDLYFTPPSGSWSVTLVVNDSSGKQVETETLTIKSRDTGSIGLKALQVCDTNPYSPSKGTACGSPAVLLSNLGYLAATMPTNKVNPQLTSLVVTSNSLPYAHSSSNTPFSDWESSVAQTIDQFYTPTDQVTDYNLNQRTTYFGLYNPENDAGGNSVIGGHGAIAADSSLFFQVPTQIEPKAIAHETGHTLGLRHTNLPGPQLPTPPGCFGFAKDPNTYWHFSTNNVQSSAGPEFGFDVLNQKLKNPTDTFDLMSYCYPDWISPIQYARAIAALGGGTVALPSAGSQPLPATKSQSAAEALPLAAPTLTPGSYLQVGGAVNPTGVTLDPIFTQSISASTDPGTGTYSVVLEGASGQALYTRDFTPESDESDLSDGTTKDYSPVFSEWIPVTPGAASVVVLDPNGIVLASESLAGTAPIVTITSPLAGFVGSGQQTVGWTVQSTTATSFTSRIFYSIDSGATWQLIAVTSGVSDTIDFSTIPGATSAILRIDVSDGVKTGSATSVPFSVPKKVPSTIVINTPATGALQLAADPVYLTGAAYDADDGMLQGAALQWSDNVQGALGSGSQLALKLNPGSHTITLTATDSDGNAISTTTRIMLAGGPPTVTLSTANTSAFCVNATINASPGSQEASLSLVEYSLDGGNTYTVIPSAQIPYTFQVPGTGTVTLVAAALDASGQVDAQSTVLNLGTGCAATPPVAITPTVTVSPSLLSITTTQALTVTIGVNGGSGNPIPTGSVTLSSGSYTSAATTLSGGSAMISIPAGSLAAGIDTLTVSYTPDSASSSTYNNASGSNSVTVTAPAKSIPTVTVTASSTSITTAQGLTVTIAVSGGSGNPTPTGSVILTSGGYTSASTSLNSSSTTINIPAGSLATGSDSLTASYSGDGYYIATNGTGSVTVTVPPPPGFTVGGTAVSVTPGATSGNTSTVTVSPSGGFTGSVALTAAITSSPTGAQYPPTLSFGSTTPMSITGAAAGTATLTISTTAATSAALSYPKHRGVPWYAAGGAILSCILLFGIPTRCHRLRMMLGMLAILATLAGGVVACGGGSSNGGGKVNPGTTAGSYTATVTGTSGSTTATGTVTFTVQ